MLEQRSWHDAPTKSKMEDPRAVPRKLSLQRILSFAVTQHSRSRTAADLIIISFQVAGTDHKGSKDVDILTFHLRIFHPKPNF